MRHGKVDRNHGEIRDGLRAMGWYVKDTSRLGEGFADLVCAKHGRLVMAEVKDGQLPPSRRALTKAEEETRDAFAAQGVTIRLLETLDDVARMDAELTEHEAIRQVLTSDVRGRNADQGGETDMKANLTGWATVARAKLRLRRAIDAACCARGEAQWTNGYRCGAFKSAVSGSKEVEQLYEREMSRFKDCGKAEAAVEAAIKEYARIIRKTKP